MPQSHDAIYLHFIFSTKNRNVSITAELQPRLYDYIGGLCRKRNSMLLAAGGMPDHVHLLVSLNREWSVGEFMREIKAHASKWIHETVPEMQDFAWQNGYAVFSVSYSSIADVKKYIAGQARHHAKMDVRTELIAFLKRHNIPFNEKYLLA